MSTKEDHTLDATGLICPEPIMMLHGAIRDAQENDIVLLIATDPAADRDVAQFCEFLSHELVKKQCDEKGERPTWYFWIRKGERAS